MSIARSLMHETQSCLNNENLIDLQSCSFYYIRSCSFLNSVYNLFQSSCCFFFKIFCNHSLQRLIDNSSIFSDVEVAKINSITFKVNE